MKHSPAFNKLCEDARGKVREISVGQVHERLEGGDTFHFIDIREDHEWVQGHARGAKHVGRGILERDIEGKIPDPTEEIVLYCGGGYRSALSAESLQKMGYSNVWSMAGGFRGWREAGLPVEGQR